MAHDTTHYPTYASLRAAERWLTLGTGAVLLIAGASRRTPMGAGLAVSAAPLLYRGITGHWPFAGHDDTNRGFTKSALRGDRGIHIRESIRLQMPVADVYAYWRQLENLPRFMSHLERVTETSDRRSHWVAVGPAGLAVEWDAEIINEEENHILAWRSLPGSDVAMAGSVTFEPARGGRTTQLDVHLQYGPPAGKAGAAIATLLGRSPSRTVREDLRRFKQLLEAGEVAVSSHTI